MSSAALTGAGLNAPLRIALVHASDFGGGAERSVVSLHRAFRASGHESTLFVGSKQTDEAYVVEIPYVRGVPGIRRAARALERWNGWQDIYNPSFRRLCQSFAQRFDIVHFNSLWGSAGFSDLSALPALARKCPAILTMRDEWLLTGHCAYFHNCERWRVGCGSCPDLTLAPAIPRDGTRFNWARKQRLVQASRLHVVTISDYLKRLSETSPILAGKSITRIYNGIDMQTFSPAHADQRSLLRSQLGIGNHEIVVLLAGQTVEGINQGIAAKFAIAALNALVGSAPIRALVIGRSAEKVAAALKVPFTVRAFVNEPIAMADCFRSADITLVTSEVEAFGRIAAESQACGTPVVAFDSGGIPEVVSDQNGGVVVPRRDGERLRVALQRMVDDPDLRARCSSGGLAHVRSHFDQSLVADQYLALYRDEISAGNRG